MSNFIRSLVEANKVPFYVDYRTGSVRSLSGLSATVAPTIVNTPRFTQTERGRCISCSAGHLSYGHQADQVLTEATWCIFSPYQTREFTGQSRFVSKRAGASVAYDLYMDSDELRYYNGITHAESIASRAVNSFAWRHANGSIPDLFIEGIFLSAVGAADSMGTAAEPITVGAYYSGSSLLLAPLHAVLIVNEALSDANIARLHRELVAGPTVVRRPSRHFSLPYPAKTPAEYAAEGIILDVDGSGVEHTGLRPATPSGYLDQVREGPFTDGLVVSENGVLTLPAADTEIFNESDYSVNAWVKWNGGALDNKTILQGASGYYFKAYTSGRLLLNRRDSGGANLSVASFANVLKPGKWTHVCGQSSHVGSVATGNVSSVLYLDGIEVSRTAWSGVGITLPGAAVPEVGQDGGTTGLTLGGLTYHKAQNLTPAEIRAEYLLGARKCLLDARVHSDGSCPVSLAAVGAGNEIANGWKVESGTWKVVEDAPSGGRPGKRWLQSQSINPTTNPRLHTNMGGDCGSWHIRVNPQGNTTLYMSLAATNIGKFSDTGQNGYWLAFSDRTLQIAKTVNGGWTPLVYSSVSSRQDLEYWISRSFDGTFNAWVKGGTYGDTWTLVPTDPASGSLPYVDTTFFHTNGYCNVHTPSTITGDKFEGVTSYLGAMTPWEAARFGILDAEIPEPFWVVSTTDTTQSWTMNLTAGSVYVFEWGDGQSNWYTGTGANQVITHTYASAGTYTIKVYLEAADLIEFRSTNNSLSGPMPSLAGCSSLTLFYIYTNNISGTIPNLTDCSSLRLFYVYGNNLSGTLPDLSACILATRFYLLNNNMLQYTPSVLALTYTDLDLSTNSLDSASVNQILTDFTTGAGARPAAGTIDLSGGTNAAPTPSVLAAAQSALPGWTISTN